MRMIRGAGIACLFWAFFLVLPGEALSSQYPSGTGVVGKKTSEIGLSVLVFGDSDYSFFLGRLSLAIKMNPDKRTQIVFNLGFGDYHEHHGDLFFLMPMVDYCYFFSLKPNFQPYAFVGAIGLLGMGGGLSNEVFTAPWISCGVGFKIGLDSNFGLALEFRLIPFYWGTIYYTIAIPTLGFYARW